MVKSISVSMINSGNTTVGTDDLEDELKAGITEKGELRIRLTDKEGFLKQELCVAAGIWTSYLAVNTLVA